MYPALGGRRLNNAWKFCHFLLTWERIPGSPRFSVLQVMEGWAGPGNEASCMQCLGLSYLDYHGDGNVIPYVMGMQDDLWNTTPIIITPPIQVPQDHFQWKTNFAISTGHFAFSSTKPTKKWMEKQNLRISFRVSHVYRYSTVLNTESLSRKNWQTFHHQ